MMQLAAWFSSRSRAFGSHPAASHEILASKRCNCSAYPIGSAYRDQGEGYARKLTAAGVSTRAIGYNCLNHAFLDKVGVWPYGDDCIQDIAAVLVARR
jgi:acetyl esterase/lipase